MARSSEEVDLIVKAITQGFDKVSTDMSKLADSSAKTGTAVQKTGTNFTEMASKMAVVNQAVNMTKATFGQIWSVLEQGSALNLAADRFDNLTASIGTTSDALMSGLTAATGGMVSNAALMESATSMISLGLAKTQAEVIDIVSLSSQLGWDQSQLVLTLANNSTMRLDSLGLSMEDVKNRAKALEAQGYDTDKAFDMAVIEAGKAKLELLGSAADTGAGAMKRLTVEFDNLKTSAMGFIAMRSEGALIGLANSVDAVGEASDAGHSNMRNFLVVMAELTRVNGQSAGFDNMIASMEAEEAQTVENVRAYTYLIDQYAAAASGSAAVSAALREEMRSASAAALATGELSDKALMLENHLTPAEAAIVAANASMHLLAETTKGGEKETAAYARGTNNLADAFFSVAAAAVAEQAALLGTFNALSQNEEALADYAIIMEGVQTHSVKVSGATDEQKAALEDLQSEYEKAQETITSYQIGVKGVGLSEDERNEKIAEQQELMGQLSAAMEPLAGIQSEYMTVTDGGAKATELLNEKLFGQIQASSDSAAAIALAGVALGVYTEAEANAMLKSALLEEMIRKQAEAWDGTAAGLATIQGNIEGYISVLNGIPDVINTTVSTDYQSTGTPPPWAGGPSAGDTGESGGQWGGEQMAAGGLVTGGVPGRDSVPALLMPGERVLTVAQNRQYEAAMAQGGTDSRSFTWNVNTNGFNAEREQRNAMTMHGGI